MCGERFPKKDLIRVACAEGNIIYDSGGKSGGRGAYICKNPDCHDKLLKKRVLDRAFRRSVSISVYEEILKEINQSNG